MDYLTLRKSAGWIGLHIESSISSYYYTGMGNVFVGLLCAIGVFHLATEGYDLTDRIAGRLACAFALGVAWFPTTPEHGIPTHTQSIIGTLHYTFAASLFAILAFFCIRQFTQTTDINTRTERKKERNVVYYVCGSIIVGCIVVIGTVKLVVENMKSLAGFLRWLNCWKWNFWFESLALVAFGIAFLIKGEFILKDETQPIQTENVLPDNSV